MLDSKAAHSTRRKSSRSNSTSSSSIITVQRATSLSSRSGPKTSYGRPQSPDQHPSYLSPPGSLGNPDRGRSRSHVRVGSANGFREGVANLNRWSQSTSSSRPSTPAQSTPAKPGSAHKRRTSFSRRLSFNGEVTGSPSRNVLTKARPPNTKLDPRQQPTPLALSSSAGSDILDPASKATTSLSTSPALITPSSRSVESGDYFIDTWNGSSQASSKNTTLGPETSASGTQSPRDALSFKILPPSRSYSKSPQNSQSQNHLDGLDSTPISHSRNREGNKGSGGTDGGSTTSSIRSERRKHRPASQKTMLSKALQKANTAVLLDNAQNFEQAMDAYDDACKLLQQVMVKSAGDEDKRKLQSIRTTYLNRINELRGLDSSYQVSDGKALPHRPMSDATTSTDRSSNGYSDAEDIILGTATTTRIVNNTDDFSQYQNVNGQSYLPARQSLLPSAVLNPPPFGEGREARNFGGRSQLRNADQSITPRALAPFQTDYLPAPLSPRRGTLPNVADQEPTSAYVDDFDQAQDRPPTEMSTETTSWLDTIDESGGSSRSSVHSVSSSMRMRRRQLRTQHDIDDTEVEFEAALDAAVEAAYDDGYEIAEDDEPALSGDDKILQNRRNIELAKRRVQEAAMEAAQFRATQRNQNESFGQPKASGSGHDFLDDETEEEERLLEEMTRGYAMDEFEFGLQSKSALPRQSDSSGFSGRTWPSSMGSNTANTSLSPSTDSVPISSKQKLPLRPPPLTSLPQAPMPIAEEPTTRGPGSVPSVPQPINSTVRDRRLSSQNPKQLTIDTNTQRPKPPPSLGLTPVETPTSRDDLKTATMVPQIQYSGPMSGNRRAGQTPSPLPEEIITRQTTVKDEELEGSEEGSSAVSRSPQRLVKATTAPEPIRKNKSATSLKSRNLSVSGRDLLETSPITPNSSTFPITIDGRKGLAATIPVMPTPTGNNFTVNGLPTGGMYLFDDHIRSPASPESAKNATSAPLPLEPCPESFLLRPFWLMRCLFQTITHPRGGYLSNKLFVPRDVWRVKNVKVKGVEEKIASCDLLTAALQKLAKVDTYDADAVLDEMQAFETVLEQVRVSLSKKLGNEVGVQNSASLFKGATADESMGNADTAGPKTPNVPGKSYLSSWRKLRNKSSGPALTTIQNTTSNISKDSAKDSLTLPSLPMTSSISSRPSSSRRTSIPQVQPAGPNANYMGALGRLCDSVQILDQIARQVEDPGLKYSSQTHVGLELSTRNAAEFFGFYICRFALNDISMMLDKFIKRGSEWVLA